MVFNFERVHNGLRIFSLVFVTGVAWLAWNSGLSGKEKIFCLLFTVWSLAWLEFSFWSLAKIQEKTRLSITDELTGLYNDRCFYRLLEDLVRKQDSTFGLIKLAIDNLIQYNEKYGYQAGDALIKEIALHLNKIIKPDRGEKAFRYGGGQFLVVLPGANIQETQNFTNLLRMSVEGLTPPPNLPENEKIEVNLGMAFYPVDGQTTRDMINAMNQALEAAKEAKNREYEEYRRRSEKLAVVGQLAAGLAHEIRNPLTTVKGFCNLIKEHTTEATTLEYINILLPELDRVCELVKEFLFLTKPAAPKLRPVSLQELVRGTIALMESEALLKDVVLVNEVAEDLPPVMGDFEQLKQVLINLILNSIEAIPGKGCITVRAYENVEKKIVIEIEDTGKGIPSEKIVKVFEPFFTTKEEGTGLGLSIANQIVQSHHGKMTIRSIVGRGTTVAIELPLAA